MFLIKKYEFHKGGKFTMKTERERVLQIITSKLEMKKGLKLTFKLKVLFNKI